MKRFLVVAWVFVIAMWLTACGGGGSNPINVSVAQSGSTTTIEAGSSPVTLTASVVNATSNAGVTWSLSPSSGCGTLTSSGTTATYTAPAQSALNADCTATIATTSVANSAKAATIAFTIKAIAIALPTGESATQAATGGGSNLTLSASIAEDVSNSATLNWSITSSTQSALTRAASYVKRSVADSIASTCGSLSNSTGNSVNYIPPTGMSCSATVTVSTSANPNVTKSFIINVSLPVLTASVTAANKTYDGLNSATTTCSLTGVMSADTGNVSCSAASAAFSSVSAGTGKAVTATGISLSGTAAGNYTLSSTTATTKANITARPLTVTAAAGTKSYDGTTSSSGTPTITSGSLAATDTAAWTQTYDSKNAGTTHVLTPRGTVSDGNGGGNYSVTFAPVTTGVITARTLTVTAAAGTKSYDGTTSSTGVPTITSGSLAGTDTVAWTQTYDNKNVGTAHVLTPAGTVSDGNGGGNYSVTFASLSTGVITARPLTVTGLSASNKVYDGTTLGTLNGSGTLVGVVSGDTVALSGSPVGTFAGAGIGTGITVNVSGLSITGTNSSNYTLTQPTSSANITAKGLTVTGLSASNKVYDGTTLVTLNGPGTLVGVVGGDTVTLSGTPVGAFISAGVGTGITVNVSGLSITGTNSGNYTLTQPSGLVANIGAKALTVTGLSANNKTYNGTTSATLNGTGTLVGVVGGDTVALSGTPTGAFASAGVGTNLTVNVSGLSITGISAGNYTLTQPTALANITGAALTVTGLSAGNKVYDGTPLATLNGSGTLVGVVSGDTVVLSGTPVGAFASAGVGTNLTVNVSGLSITGTNSGNYTLTQPTALANITAKGLTVTGLSASDKVYDGTTLATLSGTGTLVGVLSGDTVTLNSSGATAAFASKNMGAGIMVTVSGLGLSGISSGNYALTQPAGLTASISAKGLTVTGLTAANKVYNGTTSATLNGTGTLVGVVGGDTVTLSGTPTGAFASAGVGTSLTVNVSGLSISGAGAGNYTLTQPGLMANITSAALTVTGLSASNKVYDGTTLATLNGTGMLMGAVGGDILTLNGTPVGAFTSASIGTAITVNVSGLSVTGTNSSNYTLTQPTISANITAKGLTVTGLSAGNKVYDGKTLATLNGTGTLVGVVSGDTVTLSGTPVGNFVSAGVGTVPVNVSGLSITGTNSTNYTLAPPSGLAANITPATLTVTANDNSMMVGGPFPIFTASYSGFVNGENASVLSGSPILTPAATLASPVGAYSITPTQGVLFAANYTFTFVNGTLTINPLAIFVTLAPNVQQNLEAGQTLPFTPTVSNDSGNGGVTLTLNPPSGCGTLSANTDPSGTQVTYTAPLTTLSNPCSVTVTATSVSDITKSAWFNVSVSPALTLPSADPDSLGSATTNQGYNGSINAAGGIAPYTWTVTGQPSWLIASNGTGNTLSLSGMPTSVGPASFNVSVKDSAGVTVGPIQYSVTVNSPGSMVSGQINSNNCGGSLPPITVSINTNPVQTTTTDNNGNFTFMVVPNGTYTITPSISGASSIFYPVSQTGVVVNNSNVNNVNFSGSVGYTVSGTVAYGGVKSGQVYLQMTGSNCGGPTPGTSVSATGDFTIRGVPPGTYTLQAWMDNLGQGVPNASNPSGSTSNVAVSGADLAGVLVTLGDPGAVTLNSAPGIQGVSPFETGAFVQFKAITDNNGVELPLSYTLQWSTDPLFGSIAGSHSFAATGANGNNMWIVNGNSVSGLADGGPYYFRAQGVTGSSTSPWSTVSSAVTIGAPTGNTVSGLVTFTGSATGPLYVGFYDQKTNNVYLSTVANPVSPYSYTMQVPTGSNYQLFGVIDQNNDGMIDVGDISNTNSHGSSTVSITGNTTGVDETLPNADSTATVTTQANRSGTMTNYNLNVTVSPGNKMPVAVALDSGPNVLVIQDIGACSSGGNNGCGGNSPFQFNINLGGITPVVGDTYSLQVTYSDGTTAPLSAAVTAVLNAFATNLAPQTATGNANLTPTFTWTYPANAGNYTYQFYIQQWNGPQIWSVPGNNSKSNGFSSSVPSITFGTDPTDATNDLPSGQTLTNGTTYNWSIQAQDSNGNSAQTQVFYEPGGLSLSLPSPNPSSLGSATVNNTYNGSISPSGGTQSGGTQCYNWHVTGLSDNLNWNSNCSTLNISGTPNSPATVSFDVTVTDFTGASYGPVTYTIAVN